MKKKILIKIAIPVVTIAIAAIICVFSFNNKSDNEYSKTDNKKDNITYDDTLDLDKEVYSDSKADSDDSTDSTDTLDLHKEVYSNSKAE